MYLMIEENPNCRSEERVFSVISDARKVTQIQLDRAQNGVAWYDVTGIDEKGQPTAAQAQRVDDSADGTAWLITGGAWGLRLRVIGANQTWDIKDSHQWGEPFLVLDSSGKDFR